jgi:hypothetical protein
MNAKTIHLETNLSLVTLVPLLMLLAGPVACGAAPGAADDGTDPSTSTIQPTEQAPHASTDTDAAAAGEEPTGELPVPPTSQHVGGSPARGVREK